MLRRTRCRQVVLSSRALTSVFSETYSQVDTETGGILIGFIDGDRWYVVESADPGPNSHFTPTNFEYDTPYVNHLCNKLARLYRAEVRLLGLWHRHPGSLDQFSPTDAGTNAEFARLSSQGAISAIVNLDPQFRFTVYHVALPLSYERVGNVVTGDEHFPPRSLDYRAPEEITTVASESIRSPRASVLERITGWGRRIGRTAGNEARMKGPRPGIYDSDRSLDQLLEVFGEELEYLSNMPSGEVGVKFEGGEFTISFPARHEGRVSLRPIVLRCGLDYSGPYVVYLERWRFDKTQFRQFVDARIEKRDGSPRIAPPHGRQDSL